MAKTQTIRLSLSYYPILGIVCLTLLTGCGFHLRSYSFSGTVDSYALVGKSKSAIAQTLRQNLRGAGVDEVNASEATLVVELLDIRQERRSASTGGGARAAEYETSFAVQYRLADPTGAELTAPTWIERQRVYRIDRGNIVGSSEEQALLENELIQDVAGQIIRAMDAVSRNLEGSTDAG